MLPRREGGTALTLKARGTGDGMAFTSEWQEEKHRYG